MLRFEKICKCYGTQQVLQNVSGCADSFLRLDGPSGSGKTTLLRILLGLERPDSGELLGTGVRWSAVFQEDRLLDGLDAMGNLRFALGSGWDEAATRRLLAELGLSDAEDRPVREWSGGMKRRLALARALLADAEAIALDEPFAGLDAENRRRGAECIARRAETTPVLLVTHDRADLEALNARIIELRQGEIRRGSTS